MTVLTPVKTVPLLTVATIERDVVNPAQIQKGTLYVGLEHVDSDGHFVGVQTVDEGELASSKFAFSSKHVLYGKLRPYLAKIARPDFSGVCSTDILPILPGKNLDGDFLCHFLRLPRMVALAASRATGINLPRLSPKTLAEFGIPLPPLSEQRRIAAILDKANALRTKRRAALEQLNCLTQSMFSEVLSSDKAHVSVMSVEDAMEEIIDYRGKSPEKTESGVPLVTARVVKGGDLLEPTEFIAESDYLGWMRRGLPKPGDVVFTTEAPLGEVAQLDDRKVALAQRLLVLRGKPSLLNNTYLKFVMTAPQVSQQIEARATGSTVRGIRQSQLRKVLIPVPHLRRQHEFAQRVGAIERIRKSYRASTAQLDALFATLQDQAFNGAL